MTRQTQIQPTTIKILGKEYRIRTDGDPNHIEQVAAYVDRMLRELQRTIPDTQDAAILAALNIASEHMKSKTVAGIPRERIQALIDLVESA